MDDTDQLLRVTTPFIRPGLETLDLDQNGQLDRTPTTAPGNTPGTPRRRLARGTLAPPVEVLGLEPTALPVRLIDPPTRWSYRERVVLGETFYAQQPVAGEIDTAPVRRVSETPWGWVVALGSASVFVLAMIYVVLSSGSSDAKKTVPVAAAIAAPSPTTVVVALPDEPAEIEMPVQEVATAPEAAPAPAPAPAAAHATLMIGSKPPCRILIDGRDTGLVTPNRSVRVPAGRHTITLVNEELGIRHAETLNITGGRKAKMIRDLSHAIVDG